MIKACVNWIKPKLEDEFCEYFENEYTQKYFKSKGLEFKNPEELSDFLRQGKLITICLAGLARAANITLSSEAFEKEISDPIYANSYKTMVKDVCGLCLDMEKKTTNFLPKGFLTASVFPNFLSLQP